MTPLYNKRYSFDGGAKSENLEVINALKLITEHLSKRLKFIFDRGMDRNILKNFIIVNCVGFILRLKRNSKFIFQGKELAVSKISKHVSLSQEMRVIKIKKNKKVVHTYKCYAVKVQYKVLNKIFDLWLVVTKKDGGGYCWLLTNTPHPRI